MGVEDYTRPCRPEDNCSGDAPHDAHLTPEGRAHYLGERFRERPLFEDATSVEEVLGNLAGYASLCWKEQLVQEGKYGRDNEYKRVFDDKKANEAVYDAHKRIKELQA